MLFENEYCYPTKYTGYFVTASGKVISTKVKGGRGKINNNLPREHCYKKDKDGYCEVLLSLESGRKYMRVHRLVYETIRGDIPNELTIDHIDGNALNNSQNNIFTL